MYGGRDYPQHANAQVLAFAMIETASGLDALNALDALDAIAAVPHLDGLFVGPSDLGIALGLGPGAQYDHPVMAKALQRVAYACAAAGKVAGVWCGSAEMAHAMSNTGYGFVVPGHDVIWLQAEMARRLAVVRSGA